VIAASVVMMGASACSQDAGEAGEQQVEQTSESTVAHVTASQILAKLGTCHKVSSGKYAKDSGGSATIDICDLPNAVWFNADMDIDCDGKKTAQCNKSADPSWQSSTAAEDSNGNPLDAAALPYVVVPGISSRWSYKSSNIGMGSVVAVIYNGKVSYGIVGDIGPTSIIGEASYAMAKSLGVDPDPATGGVDSGVTYVIFKGKGPTKNEDHDSAVSIGESRAQTLVGQ
jgi:hypothetical protein